MAKVIVTGANGFLGSWLVRGLLAQNHEVSALVRKSSDLSELQGVPCQYLYGDVTDLASLQTSFAGMDAVFHLAGLIAYRRADREKMQKINVGGTQNVIDTCLHNQIPRLIHLSSVVAVGAGFSPQQILNEESQYNVGHLNLGYFETKHQAEQLLWAAVRDRKLPAVALNPSTIYGAGDARKGTRKTQLKVAQGKFPFYTSGGVNVVNVESVVEAIISAWKVGRIGERYILAGDNITIRDVFTLIAKAAGVEPPKHKIPDSVLHLLGTVGDLMTAAGLPGSPMSKENAWTATLYHWFDASKAKKELNFKPVSAEIAIGRSIEWCQQQGLLKS